MDRLFSRAMPGWSDRAAVSQFAVGGAEILGDDPAAARATAERVSDRTPGTEPAVQMANQTDMVFSKLDCKPRWCERLPEFAIREGFPIWKVAATVSKMESSQEPPTHDEATAALTKAEATRARFAGDIVLPPWFAASIGAAISAQIATTALGPGNRTPWLIARGVSVFAIVGVLQLLWFRRLMNMGVANRQPG